MRILIFEPNVTGHHGPYLRHLIGGLSELDQRPTVVTRKDACDLPEFGIHLADVMDSADIDASIETAGRTPRSRAVERVAALQASLERHRPDHVWIPYADGIAQVLGMRAMTLRPLKAPAGCELEGLFFRGGFAYDRQPLLKKIEYAISRQLMLRAGWSVLHLLDPLPYERLRLSAQGTAQRIELMPDPVEPVERLDISTARRQLDLPEKGRYVVCAGRLDRRKGVDLVLAAFREALPRLRQNDRLLLAGPVAPEIQPLLQREYARLLAAHRIILIDRVLSVTEIVQVLSAADLIAAPYPSHIGSASFVIRAAAVGRPVLGSDFGWIGNVVPRFELGWTCSVREIEAFAGALVAALDQTSVWKPCEAASRFVAYHSPTNFGAHWTSRLRERLGQPQHPGLLKWTGVIAAA